VATDNNGEAKRRAPLSRQSVFEAAVHLADRDGVAGLSMRRLAQELGVEAMSLYHHVANKEAILDGMVDLVFGEIELPATDVDWRVAMRRRALSARRELLRHPWSVGLMETRKNPGPATLRHHDAVLGCLRRAGFSIALAGHVFSLIDSYVVGFVLQEQNIPIRTADELAGTAEKVATHMPEGDFPYLAEMMIHATQPGYAFADEFENGLDLILEGIARRRQG